MEAVQPRSRRWKQIGFCDWSDPEDAAQLIDHLTELFGSVDIPESARQHFRTSLAASWAAVGNPEITTRPAMDTNLLVERVGDIGVLSRTGSADETLYVSGKADQSASARLVRELGWPTVLVETEDPERLSEVARVLADAWHDDIQVTSDWNLEVRVNGAAWKPSQGDPLITSEFAWLPLLLGSVMRFPQTSGIRIGRQLTRVLDDISGIRVVHAKKLAIVANAGDQPIPERLHGVLPIPGGPIKRTSLLFRIKSPTARSKICFRLIFGLKLQSN